MFPQVSDIFNYFLGTSWSFPVQTYGFFMAVAFLVSAWILRLELKRKEREGILQPVMKSVTFGKPAGIAELIAIGIAGFLIGYKVAGIILDYSEFAANTQTYVFSLRGSWPGGIIISAAVVLYRFFSKKKKQLFPPEVREVEIHPWQHSSNILIIAAVSGIIGSKIFHNLENFDDFLRDPVNQLFSFMGLTFYGGLITAAIAVGYYGVRNKIPVRQMMDVTAPAIIIGYAIGRLGCMMSGDGCWGIENLNPKPGWLAWLPDWMWAYNFPHNVVGDGIAIDHCSGKFCTVLEHPVYPTSFYDFVTCMGIFFLLWFLRKKIRIPGLIFAVFVFVAGVQRLLMEQIRVNNRFTLWGIEFTQAELISVAMIVFGVVSFALFYRKEKKSKKYPESGIF